MYYVDMKDVDVLVGEQIIVNCTLRAPQPDFNSSDMYFLLAGQKVDEQYVSRPDSLTIQLNITASLDLRGHLFCHVENSSQTLSHQMVEVHSECFCVGMGWFLWYHCLNIQKFAKWEFPTASLYIVTDIDSEGSFKAQKCLNHGPYSQKGLTRF